MLYLHRSLTDCLSRKTEGRARWCLSNPWLYYT